MKTLEASTESGFTKWLKLNKIKCRLKKHGELLDRELYLPTGRIFIIEFKRKGGHHKLLRRQEIEINELRQLGFDVEVHDDWKEAAEAVGARLEAARLSEEGDKVRANELLRGFLLRSRIREDQYSSRHNKNVKEERVSGQVFDHRALARGLQRLAKRDRKVD